MQKQQQQPRKEPEPIPVKTLQFSAPQDGPGFGVKSSLSHRAARNDSRWEIDYRPWMRAFCVVYHPSDGTTLTGYIPESRVACWYPMD